MDLQALYYAVSILSFLVSAAAAFFVWYRTRSQARRDEIDKLALRVQKVETGLDHAPTQQQIEQIHRDIAELSGYVRELSGAMKGLKDGVDIIHQHLLSRGSDKG